MEGVVSRAVRISIDFQSTLATLERLGDAEIRVPGTTVTARLGRTRLKGAIGDDDFTVPKRRVLKRFHEFKCFLASVALIRCVVRLYLFFVRLNVSTPTFSLLDVFLLNGFYDAPLCGGAFSPIPMMARAPGSKRNRGIRFLARALVLACALALLAARHRFRDDDAGNRPSDEGAEANQTSRIVKTTRTMATRTTTPTVTRTPLNSRCVGTEHTFAMNKSERDKTHFERAACGAANTTQIGFESNGAEIACTFRKMAYNEGLCVGKNIILDVDAFESYIFLAPQNPVDPNQYAPPTDGLSGVLTSSVATCPEERSLTSNPARFGLGGAQILARGFQGAGVHETHFGSHDSSAHESSAIVFVIAGSYGAGNPWHELEQVMNLYEVMLAHALPRGQGRVIIFDSPVRTSHEDVARRHVPIYGELLRRVFSSGHTVTSMAAYVDEVRRNRTLTGPFHSILFHQMAFVPHGGTSVLSRGGGTLGCKPSPKVTSFVAHVLDALPDVRDIESSLKAIFIVRGDRTSYRKVRVPGYDIILERIQNDTRARVVDLAEVGDVIEQMKVVRSARAIVGIHGAGLTQALWMRPDSLVLEISTGFRCHCYRALADFAGHAFESLEASSREPEKLASAVLNRLGLG